jgi:hypothetical protein
MGRLDEVSAAIGALQADVATLLRLSERQDTTTDWQNDRLEMVAADVRDLRAQGQATAKEVADMRPHVEHYATVRKFLALIGTALLAAGSAAGAGVVKLVDKWFS